MFLVKRMVKQIFIGVVLVIAVGGTGCSDSSDGKSETVEGKSNQSITPSDNKIIRTDVSEEVLQQTRDQVLKKERSLNPDFTNPGSVEYPDWFKNSFLDLPDDIKEAANASKRLLIFFHQDGCPYCKKMVDVNLKQKDIVDYLKQKFDVITINMWGDREVTDLDENKTTEKILAEKMRVMFTPTLLFMDEQGKVVLRVNGYYHPVKFKTALQYVAEKQHQKLNFRSYYAQLERPKSFGSLHTQTFLQPEPHLLTRVTEKDAKPMLVLFEQKDCPACDELHEDIFARIETLNLLEKFDIVQLDIWSKTAVTTPLNVQTTATDWATALDIKYTPSMVFFEQSGKESFRAEAYFKSFHTQSILDYISSADYKKQPSFQRYIEARADRLREENIEIRIMD